MARRGIDNEHEKKILGGGPIPAFKPRRVVGGKVRGLAGKPFKPIPTPTITTDTETLEQEFKDLKTQFDTVGALLDTNGETMRLCQNLPPVIQERYVRQKKSDESCWGFYKRMVALAMESPAIDVTNAPTNAERIAAAGNDIVSDPFGNDEFGILGTFGSDGLPSTSPSYPTRQDGFNENPGKATLLMMLFLAILKLIVSAVFGVLKYPLKLLQKSDQESAAATSTGFATIAPPSNGSGGFLAIGKVIKNIIQSLAFSAAINIATDWVGKKILKGPKLSRDVERFDSLVLTGFVKETAYQSEEDYWPEAAQLFPHYHGLNKQYDASVGIFDYYKKQGLHQADEAVLAAETTGDLATQIPSDMLQILTLQKDYYKSSLDRMNRLLGGGFTDNLLCCLFRFLSANDDKFLRICQAILRISMNRQALVFESLDSALGNLWQTIQKIILSQILAILSNLFDVINKEVRKKLSIAQSSDLRDLASCVSWNAFVDNMLKYIRDIENSILDLAIDLNNSLTLQQEYQVIYIQGLEQNKEIKRLLKLIDLIVRARQNGELCKNSAIPTDAELDALYRRIGVATGSEPETGDSSTSVSSGASGSVRMTNLSGRDNFNECLKKIPQEDVEKVTAWINQLTKGQS
jgi:hypothetical protein